MQGQSHQLTQIQSHNSLQQHRPSEYIDVIDENAYDSIEEVSDDTPISVEVENIGGNDIPVDNDKNNSSTNSNECVRDIDDNYLTPCELLKDKIELQDNKNIKPKMKTLFGKEDTSSESDKNSMDSSGYLKPVRITVI